MKVPSWTPTMGTPKRIRSFMSDQTARVPTFRRSHTISAAPERTWVIVAERKIPVIPSPIPARKITFNATMTTSATRLTITKSFERSRDSHVRHGDGHHRLERGGDRGEPEEVRMLRGREDQDGEEVRGHESEGAHGREAES